jgi:hypothetical protein
VRRLRAAAQIALTALLALVLGLGVLGSSRLASACMRLSLVEAPCCAPMRAPARVEGPESCCRAGQLNAAHSTDCDPTRTDVPPAAWIAQPSWSADSLALPSEEPQLGATLDRARPPPLAPHLAFTLLRC